MLSTYFFIIGVITGAFVVWMFLRQKMKMSYSLGVASVEKDVAVVQERVAFLTEQKEVMKTEFQNIANRILEEKSHKFTNQNKENIDNIILPLRDQLKDFKKRVEDVYDRESQSRASLYGEIKQLKDLNNKVSQDAVNLTNALKGSKAQGNWGEQTLKRLLELSGLQEGIEYDTQVCSHDDKGDRFFPDTIIRLPDKKDVVVDSKVSLTAYEEYCSCTTEEEKNTALKNHTISIRNHIRDLSEKNYDQLKEVNSLDFVCMFIPIESAFITAIKYDNKIFTDAFSKNIVIVCPSTLLTTLKTIAFAWRIENQNINAIEIATKATALYDKFCGFINTLQSIGDGLKKTTDRYNSAVKQLYTGKGCLTKRVQEFEKLGIKGKKSLPEKLEYLPDVDVQPDDLNHKGGENGE